MNELPVESAGEYADLQHIRQDHVVANTAP